MDHDLKEVSSNRNYTPFLSEVRSVPAPPVTPLDTNNRHTQKKQPQSKGFCLTASPATCKLPKLWQVATLKPKQAHRSVYCLHRPVAVPMNVVRPHFTFVQLSGSHHVRAILQSSTG